MMTRLDYLIAFLALLGAGGLVLGVLDTLIHVAAILVPLGEGVMRIKWEVEDGYVGKSRPHYCEIPDEEFEGMTDEEKEEYIWGYIQEEFEQTVSFSYDILD